MNATTVDTMLGELERPPRDPRYTLAAWMAIGAAALTPPSFLLSVSLDTVLRSGPVRALALSVLAIVYLAQMAMGIWAFTRLRLLLNERFAFHRVDTLISLIIVGSVLITLTSLTGRIFLPPAGDSSSIPLYLVAIVPILVFGVGMGILSLIFGIRLLEIEEDPYRLLRPYAYLSIAGGICFVSVILVPLGGFLMMADQILLGLLFFRAASTENQIEFV